jgi:hypothetical protein
MGAGEIDVDAHVLERREEGVEVRMGTGEGGIEENAEGELPEADRHRPGTQARQEGPHLRIEAARIVQRDEEEHTAVD